MEGVGADRAHGTQIEGCVPNGLDMPEFQFGISAKMLIQIRDVADGGYVAPIFQK